MSRAVEPHAAAPGAAPHPATGPAAGRQGEQGFTLVELVLVATLLTMAMAIVGMCMNTATQSLNADDLVGRAMESLQRSAVRISQVARPCSLTTYRVAAVASDVPALASAVGEWIEPVDGDPRASIMFQSASGVLSMNASALTGPRIFTLELDAGEVDNDIDDDGDGMIDEGRVVLDYEGIKVALASNIEGCTFTLTGRLLAIELRSAARARGGLLQRFTIRETIYLRNN